MRPAHVSIRLPKGRDLAQEEAIADIVDAISYLNERNPTAAAKPDAEMARVSAARRCW
jgi:hypothetical protein